MKSKVMLFSEYRIENALFIQKAIYDSDVDFINIETFMLKFYLAYLHICGVSIDDEIAKKFHDLFKKINPHFTYDYSKEVRMNINQVVDEIATKLIKNQ